MNSRDGARGSKILLVDDADELLELYEMALASEGYEVKTAPLAENALQIARAWRPDLVLTDLFMPGMGGFELITRLRSDLAPPVPPIVAISGFPDAKPDALKRGASRFETKPVSIEELLQVVEDMFAPEGTPRLRPPDVVRERRDATRTIGEATLSRYLTEDPGFFARMDAHTQAVGRFFGHSTALFFLLREGKLKLVASNSPTFPLDADAAEILPLVNDVVESVGSLIVTNAVAQRLVRQRGSVDVRFLVAVPFVLNCAVIGALCLVDQTPRAFHSASLEILEYMTRRGASVLGGGPRVVDNSGLLESEAFGAMFHGSVRLAQDAGHALGFAMFEVAEVPCNGSLTALYVNLPAPSLMIGVLDRHHLAAFVVAESLDRVRKRLKLTRCQIESRLVVARTVELTYEDPVPRMEPDAFLRRGRELLTRAVTECRPFLAVDARRR